MPGVDAVLDIVGFDDHLPGADLVVTGEGRLEAQSLMGKAISGLAARAKKAGVPAIAIAGSVDPNTGAMPQKILGSGAKPQHPSINPQILRKSPLERRWMRP